MLTQTNNVSPQEPSAAESMLDALRLIDEKLAHVRKLKYVVMESAPIEPVVSRTKSYEMVIFHPFAFDNFMAGMKVSEFQLPLFGMSPASLQDWQEWSKEAAEIQKRKMEERLLR